MKTLKSEFVQTLNINKWVFSIYFKNYPFYFSIYIFCQMILSLSSLVNVYVIAVVTDKAIEFTRKIPDSSSIYPVIFLIVGSYLIFAVFNIIGNYSWRVVQYQDYWVLRNVLSERLSKLGIMQLENPEITNKSQRFIEIAGSISGYIQNVIVVIMNIVTLIGAGWFLFKSVPFVAILFIVVSVLKFISDRKFIRLLFNLSRDTTEERRKASSSQSFLNEPTSLKELILSQGRNYLADKINTYLNSTMFEFKKIRKNWNIFKFLNNILSSSVFGYGIYIVFKRVIDKVISVGQLTFEIGSLKIFADSMSNFVGNLGNLRELSIKIGDVHDLFSKHAEDNDGEIKVSTALPSIEFKNVNFNYPDSKSLIFKNLNLKIKAGEKIAIVGENGSGKTTLIKLICRLYRVSEGELKINNIDINNLEINSWHKKIAILFQDYSTYSHLTVSENIEIDSSDRISSKESIQESLKKADALEFVQKYKNGVDQILSERYKGGIRPSTGQWQKIAIARVFHRDSLVLILDEPTASIDAVAEAQIFDNIYKFAKDKTVIIISHRFSTVRNADRIIVLDKGKIVEQGSHDELLKNDGKYAHAFKLQAKGYQ